MTHSLIAHPQKGSASDHSYALYPLPLLDRLVEDDPDREDAEGKRRPGSAALRIHLRDAVLRDLAQLLQTRCPLSATSAANPHLAASVLGYGIPTLGGAPWTAVDREAVASAVRDAILRHEPRITPATLVVRLTGDDPPEGGARRVEIELYGEVALRPVPVALQLRTRIDLDQGCLDPLEPALLTVAQSVSLGAPISEPTS